MTQAEKLKALRDEMKKHGVDGFYVPRADQFQNEYVPDCAQRLSWITEFTGSHGVAIVLDDKAAFFTDSRYTIQARNEVNADNFELYSVSEGQGLTSTIKPSEWLEKNLKAGGKFALDPMLHTAAMALKLKEAVKKVGAELVFVENNFIDNVWADQPSMPQDKVFIHPLEYAGKSTTDKLVDITKVMTEKSVDYLAVTATDNICWLLNVRGNDVEYNPIVLSYALINKTGQVEWFVDKDKVDAEVEVWVKDNVVIKDLEEFENVLAEVSKKNSKVWLDSGSMPVKFSQIVESNGGAVFKDVEPIDLMKVKKNDVEVAGSIAAHIRDGAALTRFLAVLDDRAEVAKLDEMSAADLLESFRAQNDKFKGLSFPTISGAGSNGAVVHYTVSEKSKQPLTSGSVYLVDSGAQYLDGTTDVTRTVMVGDDITDETKDNYTRVLKGHIQVALSEFPKGTTGNKIDEKARAALVAVGLDYGHGTGHGVGSFLCVHEGACTISPLAKTVPFEKGMIISNEPGYYKEGEYGIRIENLVTVIEKENGNLGFETLTLAPIDKNLINKDLLNDEEVEWLNGYHSRVREKLKPLLQESDSKALEFLIKATEGL